MLQLDAPQPDPIPRTLSEDREHALRNALSVARLQIDVMRRRVSAGRYEGADLDGALARVRGAIDRAFDVMTDELVQREPPVDGNRETRRR